MADGVRIRLSAAKLREVGDLAGRLVIVRDVFRPIARHPQNPVCRLCHQQHECKTYHLQLDGEGTVLVSTTVWANMCRLFDQGGFELVNTVTKPPTQQIIVPAASIAVTPATF